MEWFPGRVFAFFRRAAKEGRSRRSETSLVLFPSFVPAAADNTPVPVIAKPRKGLWQSVTPSILPSPPQRAILQVSADSQLASAIRFPVPSPPAGNFLCSGELLYQVQQRKIKTTHEKSCKMVNDQTNQSRRKSHELLS